MRNGNPSFEQWCEVAEFYAEDQKRSIAEDVERLKAVSFHDKISSMYDKMARTKVIAALLADQFGLTADEKADLDRAASIYKFDLVTSMVGEFPELQGIMGEHYARRRRNLLLLKQLRNIMNQSRRRPPQS